MGIGSPGEAEVHLPREGSPVLLPGAVENPDWPLLNPLAAVLNAVEDDAARLIATTLSEETAMTSVFIGPRPKGRPDGDPIDDYLVEDHADHVLKTFKTQHEAIEWATKEGYSPHVALVRHHNDKKVPDHWRAA